MKAIGENMSRHENGNLYLVIRRDGKLTVKSLRTTDLKEARRRLRDEGIISLTEPRSEPEFSNPLSKALDTGFQVSSIPTVPLAPTVSLSQALDQHAEGLVHNSVSREEMVERCRKKVLEYGKNFETFDALRIWKAYRASGKERRGKELGSACNHMKWYLGLFIPWAVNRGYLPLAAKESLSEIPAVIVNPRRIRVPSVETVSEFLAMIETEDIDGAAFLRFLGSCGLRISGARALQWPNIDFDSNSIVVMQKGKKEKVFPLTPEARAVLLSRKGKDRPWEFDDAAIERLKKRMKRFAKGFDIDLKNYHSFRHYFASHCLMARLTVQEVAELLGHSDNGQLVLRTYGHQCKEHLRKAVANLRLVS